MTSASSNVARRTAIMLLSLRPASHGWALCSTSDFGRLKSPLAFRKSRPQHPMQDLPGGGARHVVVADESGRPGALVAGDAVPAPCHKLGLGDGGARVRNDHRV